MNRVVIRLGAFYTVCTFIAGIGKRFKCSGFEDILIESDVVASVSVKGVIEGKHHNRAVRTHKIVNEAFWRLKWESFDNWLTLREDPEVNDMDLVEAVKHIRSQPCEETLDDLIGMRCFGKLSGFDERIFFHSQNSHGIVLGFLFGNGRFNALLHPS